MKIYTRTGDSGMTGLFGGGRVEKDTPAVEAYGAVDELNACIGVARAALAPGALETLLTEIQGDLLTLGAELGAAPGKQDRLGIRLIAESDVERLEGAIDTTEELLEPLRTFILPGGSAGAASLHLARTICRRAERRVLSARKGATVRDEVIRYLNRLSDLLFVLARRANLEASVSDAPWHARTKGP
ncbi:MAG TPA: cob(I)yrinic acid a,c-diamide adenosyltransferase [Polyangiaceae bacterium]|jgi:cob(I)alamin adenosyltransferase|nr:cob(I)yrinic acid a,c-diamide adenosyltransferase [Polyangiaceae bacterium]